MKKWKTRMLLPLLALMLIAAGCQSVFGFDVTKALLGDLEVKSSESSLTMSLKAVPAPGISEEDQQIVDLINSLSLTIGHLKQQENGNLSASGQVGYKGANIPFSLFMDDKAIVFTAEGAKQPFVYPIADYSQAAGVEGLTPEQGKEISKLLTTFIVKNLPNPSSLSVANVSESVYGENLSLTKVHAEVTGEQLPGLAKSFLKSVSKDTEGFTALLSGLYDYLYPLLERTGNGSVDLDEFGLGKVPMNDKEGVVTVAHDAAKLAIDTLLLQYDSTLASLYEEAPELKTVLSANTKLGVDLFVDSGFHIRKQNIALNIALPTSESLPLQSVSLQATTQVWNVNGPVTADAIDAHGAIDLSQTSLTPGQMLRSFEPNSAVYGILKNDFGITARSVVIAPDDDIYYPIVIQGTTYVPLRYIAEDLDAALAWNAVDRSISVTDDVYGDKVVFKIGSDQALVNGMALKLPRPVFVDEYGSAYVPLRFIAQALHAEVSTDEDGYLYIDRP
ncbi:copper amine oxidase N-terminal domain-containing protein [Paenibacillus sp. NFR01]|uniref:copper amine oxidase N-terminal domain-containing protein n=1 Tax=Paenibacillus sp. NFR01 TaxID=1566279 RepID=UPI0008AD4CA0|nr:copper amine oxidase N-terminal domain-containing protein [Paenibacillus sp. NFR01]SET35951.1 Copper amine oxidase N-terminal domain-containing protein [Paenibacillus sp. NFR01]